MGLTTEECPSPSHDGGQGLRTEIQSETYEDREIMAKQKSAWQVWTQGP